MEEQLHRKCYTVQDILMNEGYVYLIGTPVFGWYKIGKSKTPEIRVKNLGILLPFKVQVIGVWKAKNHHLMETSLHEIYDSHRINGEWFAFSKAMANDVFYSIPSDARVYPATNSILSLDKFSNIEQDTRDQRRVIGVRREKLRGDFTQEERDEKRRIGIEVCREKKRIRDELASSAQSSPQLS